MAQLRQEHGAASLGMRLAARQGDLFMVGNTLCHPAPFFANVGGVTS
jgi:hypothetical protein